MNTVSAGGIITDGHGHVVIVSQHGRSWGMPKGHVEGDEELLTAALREIKEETGLTQLTLVKKLGSYSRPRITPAGTVGTDEWKTIHLFLFTTTQRTLAPEDPENPEARWVTVETAIAMLTHEKDKEFLRAHAKEVLAHRP